MAAVKVEKIFCKLEHRVLKPLILIAVPSKPIIIKSFSTPKCFGAVKAFSLSSGVPKASSRIRTSVHQGIKCHNHSREVRNHSKALPLSANAQII